MFRSVIRTKFPDLTANRIYHGAYHHDCLVGSEMVDWLLRFNVVIESRDQAVGVWQVLLEEGALMHGLFLFSTNLYQFVTVIVDVVV